MIPLNEEELKELQKKIKIFAEACIIRDSIIRAHLWLTLYNDIDVVIKEEKFHGFKFPSPHNMHKQNFFPSSHNPQGD